MTHTALVTGGTRGLGAGICKALKNAEYNVIATFHGNEEKAKAFTAETGVHTYKWDVSNFDACAEGLEKVIAEHGPVDILVNNAGITRDGFLHKATPQMWGEVISTNLSSVFNMSKCVIESMRQRNFGRIINISSINGQKGQMGQTNYCAAKAGVIGFTKALALESATKGITVNAIAPGYMDTDMMHTIPPEVMQQIIEGIPLKRLGKPDEIGRAVVFLASDEAGFINGATFHINGGQYMY